MSSSLLSVLISLLYLFSIQLTVPTPENDYFIDSQTNCNNVYGATSNPNISTEWVTSLGLTKNTKDCIDTCIDVAKSQNTTCQSFTFHTKPFGGEYANHCFGRFGYPLWTPIPQQLVNCGRIIWKCTDNKDCSLNGECNPKTGNCTCSRGWKGYKCGFLKLRDVNSTSGFILMNDTENDNKPTSSWGGSVIVSTKEANLTNQTKYHMFLTEFENHCGYSSWTINSVITHAISTDGFDSPYKRHEKVHAHFAAEPDIIRGNNHEYVLYYNTYNYSEQECHCNDGSTPPGCTTPNTPKCVTVMQYTNNGEHGPYMQYFSEAIIIFENRDNDTDLGGVINSEAQFIGMLRHLNSSTGSEIHLVFADNWKDAHSYKEYNTILFPELSPLLTEDPFLWIDCKRNYHALFHNMSPQDEQQICGGHAFSEDGKNWIYGGVTYGNTVNYVNGTKNEFTKRQSPHLIFADDDCTPIALTNGAQYDGGQWEDATYTLLQPIEH